MSIPFSSESGRVTVRGLASGALIMTFFGTMWALGTAFRLSPLGRNVLFPLVGVLTIALVVADVHLLRAARRVATVSLPVARSTEKDMGRRFALVSTLEIVSIIVASNVLAANNRDEFIPLAISLIVGVHFLPLAAVFQVPVYYLTGAVMSMFALVALVALWRDMMLGGLYNWAIVVGIVNAVILWTTTLRMLQTGKQLVNQAGPPAPITTA